MRAMPVTFTAVQSTAINKINNHNNKQNPSFGMALQLPSIKTLGALRKVMLKEATPSQISDFMKVYTDFITNHVSNPVKVVLEEAPLLAKLWNRVNGIFKKSTPPGPESNFRVRVRGLRGDVFFDPVKGSTYPGIIKASRSNNAIIDLPAIDGPLGSILDAISRACKYADGQNSLQEAQIRKASKAAEALKVMGGK